MEFKRLFHVLGIGGAMLGCGYEAHLDTSDATMSDTSSDAHASADDGGSDVGLAHDRCMSAERIVLIGGRLELSGETDSATDEFSTLDCNSPGTASTLRGPQRYYVLRGDAGFRYSFVLTASFHSVFYGFDSRVGCTEREIQRACRSAGENGFASPLINPGTGLPGARVFGEPPDFIPREDTELVLVVDSDYGAGTFTLTIEATPCADDPLSCSSEE